jgi:hypothetical protein
MRVITRWKTFIGESAMSSLDNIIDLPANLEVKRA